MHGSGHEAPRRVLLFSDRAAAEFENAVTWYEREQPGLGLAFLDEVEALQALLLNHPDLGVEVRPRIRRALLRRFPYGLFYSTTAEHLRVLAIVHSHRHPARWPRRA